MQELLRKKDKKLAISFNSTFRFINDVLSLNNSKFGDYVERIYPIELEIKDTTDTVKSASYLDVHPEIDNEGRLKNKTLRQKSYFLLSIVNFPFLCTNIPATPAHEVYISFLIQYLWISFFYHDFLDRWFLLTRKLSNHEFKLVKLKSFLSILQFNVASFVFSYF